MNKHYPIYKEEYVYIPQSTKNDILPNYLTYRVLSYKEIQNNIKKYQKNSLETKLFKYHIVYDAIIDLDSYNLSKKEIMDILNQDDIENLYQLIMEKSVIDISIFDKLYKNLKVLWSNKFESDTWNCELCKAKGLQYSRACGFLPEDKRDKTFSMYVAGEVYTICPISVIDLNLVGSAIECYRMWDKGLLPEDGGVYDQTIFFVHATKTVHTVVKEKEQEALEEYQG